MSRKRKLGGVIHAYQKYNPQRFPSPTQPPPDVISGAFDHLLAFGSGRRFTDEALARAVRIDPSQIRGLGPSLDVLIAMLEERKRKILAKYETESVTQLAARNFDQQQRQVQPPRKFRQRFERAIRTEQLYDLERMWYATGDDQSPFARSLVQLIERLGGKCVDCGTLGSKGNPLEVDHVDGRDYDVRKMDPSWRIAVYEREEREGVRLAVRCKKDNANAHK